MKREGVLVGDPPMRDVVRVIDLIGPRGGTQYVMALACGHWHLRRSLPNKTRVPCVGCLVEAALKEKQ